LKLIWRRDFFKTSLNLVRDTRGRLEDCWVKVVEWDLKMREMEKLENHGCYEEFIER